MSIYADSGRLGLNRKERAREDAEQEKHRLEQQRLVAQQAVHAAEANAEARQVKVDAEAYAIRQINEKLSQSPFYVDFVRAKTWDGILPRTLPGEGVGAFPPLPVPVPVR